MKIERASVGPFYTNLYLLTAPERDDCVVVDAPPNAVEFVVPLLKKRNLKLSAILITHGHWDHNAGVPALIAQTKETQSAPPEIFAHGDDRDCHEHPEKFRAWYEAAIPGLNDEDFVPFSPTHWTADGETFSLLGKHWTALHVPGHCPGSLVFYCAEEKIAFTGDAIFSGSIGRTDLPGGDFPTLENAIRQKIYTLPNDVVLYPGHGPKTEVGAEKSFNPFVRP